jgi:calreticulin
MKSILFFAFVAFVACNVYFDEHFDASWEDRWVVSNEKKSDGTAGKFELTAGAYSGNANNKGIQTSQDARFYQISSKLAKPFSNKGHNLVFQFSVKNEQNLDCGGGYFKLLPADLDQANFGGESPYFVMFGPDVCGSTKRVHVIFNYKGKNHLINKEISPKGDQLTHFYTLVVTPEQEYRVLVDGEEVQKGKLADDWDFLPPKKIKDPKASKPSDWVDEAEIPDPSDHKPEGYDSIPATIADPEAKKPEDWDDELDGAWEAPAIANPEYKGEWKPKMISNPDYKGPWEHPLVDNPEYHEDKTIGVYDNIGAVGVEIWQVKSGTIFDNILVTDNVEVAQKRITDAKAELEAEKAAQEKSEKEKREKEEAERKAQEEADKKKETKDETDKGEKDANKDEL